MEGKSFFFVTDETVANKKRSLYVYCVLSSKPLAKIFAFYRNWRSVRVVGAPRWTFLLYHISSVYNEPFCSTFCVLLGSYILFCFFALSLSFEKIASK